MTVPTQPDRAVSTPQPKSLHERCRFTVPEKGRFVIWEVTRFCNLECRHCCTYSGPQVSTAEDVTTDRMVSAARELPEVDVTEVLFSGGEPLLRRDMMEILFAIDADRTQIYMASNGTTIRDSTVRDLMRARVAGIDISVDGHTAELHQRVRVQHSSFEGALRGIEACVRGGMTLRVTSVVIPETAAHVSELIRLLVELGVVHVVLQTVLPSGGRAIEYPELALPATMFETVEEQVREARSRWGAKIEVDFRAAQSGGGADGCPAGHGLLTIAPNGDVSTCSWLYKISPERFTLGNIKRDSLAGCLRRIDEVMRPLTRQTPGCPIPIASREGPSPAADHVHP